MSLSRVIHHESPRERVYGSHRHSMTLAEFIDDEFNGDPRTRESNMVLIRSAAMFAVSVFVFRNFGELFAV